MEENPTGPGSALVDGGGALYLRVAAGCVCKASLTAPVLAAASWAALGLGALCAAKFALVTPVPATHSL